MLDDLDRELESNERRFGSGWISGVLAVLLGISGLGAVLCFRYPELLTMPQARAVYPVLLIRHLLQLALLAGFIFSSLNLTLRKNKTMGYVGMILVLAATSLGGSEAAPVNMPDTRMYFGLDWFILNLLFLSLVFVPIERIFARHPEQGIFRDEWREDLLYFLIGALFVQVLTYCSLAPATGLLHHTKWNVLREYIVSQPVLLQLFEIMFLTDLVQYAVHRQFHRVPALWRFHAVHHSAKSMDWLAAGRMHLIETIILRAFTVTPMIVLGFGQQAVELYLLYVYMLSSFIHANVRWDFGFLKHVLTTPQFHHWHHGIEKEAIDVNFAIHFPWIDKMFGTYYMPDHVWPASYGIEGHPVPQGYVKQFAYPFERAS